MLAVTKDAVGTVDAPRKVSDIAPRSVVEVLARIRVFEAASWLAGGAEVPGALLG